MARSDPPGTPLETLWSAPAMPASGAGQGIAAGVLRGLPMPEGLRRRYGGALEIAMHPDRPTVVVNFVETIDGVVALGPGEEQGGGVISGRFEPDRFVMGLLRSVADVVLMGSGTIAGSSSPNWTGEHLAPDFVEPIRQWRRELGLAPQATTVIVTGSGAVRLGRRGVDDPNLPVVFATTRRGAEILRARAFAAHVTVETVSSGDRVTPDELATFLGRYRGQVVLCEGGPHLLADLVAADIVDELFLTLAPQMLGRGTDRLTLVDGLRLSPDEARWQDLVSIKRAGEHLFLRYRRR